jgi:hypothetical protein
LAAPGTDWGDRDFYLKFRVGEEGSRRERGEINGELVRGLMTGLFGCGRKGEGSRVSHPRPFGSFYSFFISFVPSIEMDLAKWVLQFSLSQKSKRIHRFTKKLIQFL